MKKTLLEYCQEYYDLTRGKRKGKSKITFTSQQQFINEIGSLEANDVINEFKNQ